MAKSIMVNGYEFVTNNFAAILDNQSAPDQFHRVHDFFESKLHWICFDSAPNLFQPKR